MIWAIGDLHFDPIGDKPMDIFGSNWINHKEKIISSWEENVKEDDLVLLVGDISWGLKLTDALIDLKTINDLPGEKVISKGNHDYWWSSMNKLNSCGFEKIHFLHNNSFSYQDIEICGTRGWIPRDSICFTEDDEKIYNREIQRLKNSIESAQNGKKKIAMIHYPPFNQSGQVNDFSNTLTESNFDMCIYGHLHSDGHKFVKEGIIGDVLYKCVSSDYVDFKLQEIEI